jgi:ribosome recycling factor
MLRSASCFALCRRSIPLLLNTPRSGPGTGLRPNALSRHYAKAVGGKELIPDSQQPIKDPLALEAYQKSEKKMQTTLEWWRKECAAAETRASGRITPAILSPVRVAIPGMDKPLRLEEMATVGVKEGSMLIVTPFEEDVSPPAVSSYTAESL